MKVRFNRWYNALLTALLGMLGFEACDSQVEYGSPMAEYGVPHADFIVKGEVTDEAGTPIPGIKTKFTGDMNYGIDSTLTDASGRYEIQAMAYPSLYNCQLIVADIDGDANGGKFQSDTLDLSKIEATQVGEGKGAWYDGKYEVTVDVQMKRQE